MKIATVVACASVFSAVSQIPSTTTHYERGASIFSQGDAANSLFLLSQGESRLVVCSTEGKESTVHKVRPGEFLGEDCLHSASAVRSASAVAGGRCAALRFKRNDILQALEDQPPFSQAFMLFLLGKGTQAQAAVLGQLFNSSEQRLARLLLSMAEDGLRTAPCVILPPITQEALAEQVGTTRSRISFFMNRFRRLGLITYGANICVFAELMKITSQDCTNSPER